jgi:hypothetical protein
MLTDALREIDGTIAAITTPDGARVAWHDSEFECVTEDSEREPFISVGYASANGTAADLATAQAWRDHLVRQLVGAQWEIASSEGTEVLLQRRLEETDGRIVVFSEAGTVQLHGGVTEKLC